MATQPQYAATPRCGIGQVSVANTARDGTGTIGTVFTAGTNGSRIESISIQATSTTTPGMVRLFLHDGTNSRLWREVAVSAATPSATAKAFATALAARTNPDLLPIHLPPGYSLRASTNNAEAFNVVAFGGDF